MKTIKEESKPELTGEYLSYSLFNSQIPFNFDISTIDTQYKQKSKSPQYHNAKKLAFDKRVKKRKKKK